MKPSYLSLLLLITSSIGYSQSDSSEYFYQKGLLEKQTGRKMESLKNFEKAQKYNDSRKDLTTELASAYFDLKKYEQAKNSFKKLVDLGEESIANIRQLLHLSFDLKDN